MNNTIIFLFAVLDYLAECIELTYDLGQLTRKIVIPAIAFTYVSVEFMYDKLTTQQYTLRVYNTPLTTGLCAIA